MPIMRHTKPLGRVFIAADQPKDSPTRMECRTCDARPGEDCQTFKTRSASGRARTHLSRRRDFQQLRGRELEIERMNALYGAKR